MYLLWIGFYNVWLTKQQRCVHVISEPSCQLRQLTGVVIEGACRCVGQMRETMQEAKYRRHSFSPTWKCSFSCCIVLSVAWYWMQSCHPSSQSLCQPGNCTWLWYLLKGETVLLVVCTELSSSVNLSKSARKRGFRRYEWSCFNHAPSNSCIVRALQDSWNECGPQRPATGLQTSTTQWRERSPLMIVWLFSHVVRLQVWKSVMKLKKPAVRFDLSFSVKLKWPLIFQEYILCAEVWVEFPVKHFGVRTFSSMSYFRMSVTWGYMWTETRSECLAGWHHQTHDARPCIWRPLPTAAVCHCESVVTHARLLNCLCYGTVLTLAWVLRSWPSVYFQDKFLPFIDMFQKESVRVEVCRSIVGSFVKWVSVLEVELPRWSHNIVSMLCL